MNDAGIVLETRRLILRRLTLDDAEFILERLGLCFEGTVKRPGDSDETSLYARSLDRRRLP